MSPTERTLKQLRRDGWTVDVAEKWVPGANIRRDLFGIIDVVAIKPGQPVLAIQATSASNISARLTKAKAEPRLRTWLEAGQFFEVWGWSDEGVLRIEAVKLPDLAGMPLEVERTTPKPLRKPVERDLFSFATLSRAAGLPVPTPAKSGKSALKVSDATLAGWKQLKEVRITMPVQEVPND